MGGREVGCEESLSREEFEKATAKGGRDCGWEWVEWRTDMMLRRRRRERAQTREQMKDAPLPCEVVSYNRLATPAVASNTSIDLFYLYFPFFLKLEPAINYPSSYTSHVSFSNLSSSTHNTPIPRLTAVLPARGLLCSRASLSWASLRPLPYRPRSRRPSQAAHAIMRPCRNFSPSRSPTIRSTWPTPRLN